MALFADFMDNSGFRPTETKSTVLVVSPLLRGDTTNTVDIKML